VKNFSKNCKTYSIYQFRHGHFLHKDRDRIALAYTVHRAIKPIDIISKFTQHSRAVYVRKFLGRCATEWTH